MSSKTKTTATKEEAKPALVPKLRFLEFRNSDDWKQSTMSGVATVVMGSSPKSECYNENQEGLPLLQGNADIKNRLSAPRIFTSEITKECQVGDILMSVRAPVGSIAKSIHNACIGRGIAAIHAKQPNFQEFLYQWLLSYEPRWVNISQGGTFDAINSDDLKYVSLTTPKPAEQQKIAECLSSVDELIAAQARKLDALKTHKKGLMQQLFPREGETQPRLRFPEFQNAGEWVEDTLDDIATFRRGSFPQPYGLPEWYDERNGVPFIQVFDVGDDFRLKDKTKSKISKLGAEKSVFIPEGTLIVTLQGSIGRVAITHYDAYIDRTLLIFESFQKPIEKVFFSRVIQNLFDIEKEKAPGGIIKTITKESLSDFKVKYPMVEEQQRIASCLSSLDALITAEAQKLEALKTHKKGLMQQLFPSPEEVEA